MWTSKLVERCGQVNPTDMSPFSYRNVFGKFFLYTFNWDYEELAESAESSLKINQSFHVLMIFFLSSISDHGNFAQFSWMQWWHLTDCCRQSPWLQDANDGNFSVAVVLLCLLSACLSVCLFVCLTFVFDFDFLNTESDRLSWHRIRLQWKCLVCWVFTVHGSLEPILMHLTIV